MKRELDSLEDIKLLVDRFYDKIRNDQLLGPIFDGVIDGRWPEHLEKMYTFWQTVLLREHTYNGSPFSPHAKLPVEGKHFDQWIALFFKTLDTNFEGEKAIEAKWRARKMADMFRMKIEHFRNRSAEPLL